MFCVIRPWQTDPHRKFEDAGQMLSAHPTVVVAYAELDRIGDRLKAGGLTGRHRQARATSWGKVKYPSYF